jgi:hypothetical protein
LGRRIQQYVKKLPDEATVLTEHTFQVMRMTHEESQAYIQILQMLSIEYDMKMILELTSLNFPGNITHLLAFYPRKHGFLHI